MTAKRTTKYEQVLNDARGRVEAAKAALANCQKRVAEASAERDIAAAELRGHVAAYEALQAALTPTPRKVSKKPSPSPQALNQPMRDNGAKCGVCGNKKAFDDHQPGARDFHEFDAAKPAAGKSAKCVHVFSAEHGGKVCGEAESDTIHDQSFGYAAYHPFARSAPRVARKSKQKTPDQQSDPNTAGATESAMSASSGGD